MNITPRPPTAFQKEFQQLIHEKSSNFVGREFAFAAITDFLNHQPCGYFTIVGTPGSGKSAILAKYVMENPSVIYYSAEVEGKNLSTEFLITVCTQLMGEMGDTNVSLPDNATEGSWFFSLLLQKVSDLLQSDQRLIIAIDGCDAPKGAAKGDRIDLNNQSPDSNLFYLPRYLPERVYFLLTRRPFLSEKSGLLIETPAQILDLEAYSSQNREDVQTYIQQYISVTPSFFKNAGWITNCRDVTCNVSTSEQEFCQQLTQQLTVKSENNFMYLNHILQRFSHE